MILETVVVGQLETNCYIFGSSETKEVLLIDPGAEPEKIKAVLNKMQAIVKAVILTHGHYDHTGAMEEFDVPIYIHADEFDFLKEDTSCYCAVKDQRILDNFKLIKDGDSISAGIQKLTVLDTPGHSAGGISLKGEGVVFSGDTLFAQGIGRTDLPGGSYRQLIDSIKTKLMILDDAVVVLPGHGAQTTIGQERMEYLYS